MHEYSIVQALIARVDAEARRHGASSIHRLRVRVGELSGVESDLLATAFETFRERSVCAGATLEIVPAAVRWECPRCGREIAAGAVLRCADCAAPAKLAAGDDIVLETIEMEVA